MKLMIILRHDVENDHFGWLGSFDLVGSFRGGVYLFPDMRARVIPFLEELQALKLQNIAIISHGMIGRVMMSYLH